MCNMAYKPSSVPEELKVLRILNNRMDLTSEQEKYYLYKEKGFEGEVQFDLLTEQLQSDCLILNDLLLEVNNTFFQIDTLILFQEIIYLFEVKNYEGDYCYRKERFETISGKEIKNSLDQLNRSTSLLRQLLQKFGYHLTIEAYVVFINPEFFLYQAPTDKPIIYPAQLPQLMRKLNNEPSKLLTGLQRLRINSFHCTRLNPLIPIQRFRLMIIRSFLKVSLVLSVVHFYALLQVENLCVQIVDKWKE